MAILHVGKAPKSKTSSIEDHGERLGFGLDRSEIAADIRRINQRIDLLYIV